MNSHLYTINTVDLNLAANLAQPQLELFWLFAFKFSVFSMLVNFFLGKYPLYQRKSSYVGQTIELEGSAWPRSLAEAVSKIFALSSLGRSSWQPCIFHNRAGSSAKKCSSLLACGSFSMCGRPDKNWKIKAPHPVPALSNGV